MNAGSFRFSRMVLTTTIILLACRFPLSAQQADQPNATPPPIPSDELPAGSQILAGGPVHEAFAKPVSMDPEAPIIVPKQPPANLQEVHSAIPASAVLARGSARPPPGSRLR